MQLAEAPALRGIDVSRFSLREPRVNHEKQARSAEPMMAG